MLKKVNRLIVPLVVLLVVIAQPFNASAQQTVIQELPLSEGVQYNKYTYKDSSVNSIDHLQINVGNPNTEVQLGLPPAVNGKESTTNMATRHSKEGNRVVGAVNASFFDMRLGYPLFLLAQNNKILNGGAISVGSDQYMNVPTAFGMTADGKGKIDNFKFDVTLSHKGLNYEMTGLNHSRSNGNAVIYTPQFYSKSTNTNEYGFEIVVDTGKVVTENSFGQTLTGKIISISDYGSKVTTAIPATGFVISTQGGDWHKKLSPLKVGDEVSTNFAIDQQWQDADFVLASGPYLVRDGKPYVMMSTSSPRAKEIAPRTVVGVSKDGQTVHFITVDGRQNHSKGMNMSQLANYLVTLGVDRAVNLDGGGSTTMGIRKYGSNNVVLANSPSNANNFQRLVSTTLLAVSKAPTGKAAHVKFTNSTNYATLLAGASSNVAVQYILDANFNALPLGNRVTLTSQNNTLNVKGFGFTTTKPGDDRIYINYDGQAVQSFPVKVVDAPTTLTVSPSVSTVNLGETVAYNVSAKDANGKDLIYQPSQLKWYVEGDIGTVTSDGKFSATTAGNTGKLIAELGTKKVEIPITVPNHALFKDIPSDYTYYKELELLTGKEIIKGNEGYFNPNDSLTRGHAAVIIARALNLDLTNAKDPGFKDVPSTHRYNKQIAAVVAAGIMDGKEKTIFEPESNLTRAQMAKVVALAYDLKGTSTITFNDVTTDMWSYEYIHLLAANGITTGYEGNIYKPYTHISRVHFSVFLYRVMQK